MLKSRSFVSKCPFLDALNRPVLSICPTNIFFFHWHYRPLWALACRKISFHFFLCSTFVTIGFLLWGVVSPMPIPKPGRPGYPFLSGSSLLTCLAWEALPVACGTASIALGDHVNTQVPPLSQSRDTFLPISVYWNISRSAIFSSTIRTMVYDSGTLSPSFGIFPLSNFEKNTLRKPALCMKSVLPKSLIFKMLKTDKIQNKENVPWFISHYSWLPDTTHNETQ